MIGSNTRRSWTTDQETILIELKKYKIKIYRLVYLVNKIDGIKLLECYITNPTFNILDLENIVDNIG